MNAALCLSTRCFRRRCSVRDGGGKWRARGPQARAHGVQLGARCPTSLWAARRTPLASRARALHRSLPLARSLLSAFPSRPTARAGWSHRGQPQRPHRAISADSTPRLVSAHAQEVACSGRSAGRPGKGTLVVASSDGQRPLPDLFVKDKLARPRGQAGVARSWCRLECGRPFWRP